MVRNSLNFVSWKMQKEVGADLKLIYSATTVDLAEQRLAEFEVKWDKDYQSISLSWRRNWAHIIPFFDYPPEIRKVKAIAYADVVNAEQKSLTVKRL